MLDEMARIAKDALKAAQKAANRFDELPISPAKLGEAAMHWHFERAERRAAQDPEWAEIEARRETGGAGKIMLSEEHDLTLAHGEIQREISERITPTPLWFEWARAAREARLGRALAGAVELAQRARRGWAESDTYSLGGRFPVVLGEQLEHLAEIAHGWPSGPEFPTYDDWVGALKHHGRVLRTLGWTEVSDEESLERWHQTAVDPHATEEDEEDARSERDDDEAAASERLTASLLWVVEHREMLWD